MSKSFPETYSHPSSYPKIYADQLVRENTGFVRFLADLYGLDGATVLDYACGDGTITHLFCEHADCVEGCDVDEPSLDAARSAFGHRLRLFHDDFFASGLPRERYDFIFCRSLVPLVKFDYDEANQRYLRPIVDSLTERGAAYFINYVNATGRVDDGIDTAPTAFNHHTVQATHDFFSGCGEVAMINRFGYTAVVVTRTAERAAEIQARMQARVLRNLRALKPWQRIEYYRCKLWLYVNRGVDFRVADLPGIAPAGGESGPVAEERAGALECVDRFADAISYSGDYEKLAAGVCARDLSGHEIDATYTPELYMISGDHDARFSYDYLVELAKFDESVMAEVIERAVSARIAAASEPAEREWTAHELFRGCARWARARLGRR